MKQQVKLYKIKGNPNNPRIIKNDKFKKLVKSIQEFPEMLKLRPIVVDEDFMVLGGNMRLKASKEAGLKEVWIDIAEGLTEEQKKEFVVKDNVNFGEWDWAMLGNEWDSTEIKDWGLDVWQNLDDNINKVNRGDENSEWVGMPEFEAAENSLKIIVHFENETDREAFAKEHSLEFTKKLPTAWATHYPYEGRKDMNSLKYE
tara:strand:+ start:262 stop:864 length:603 start_codon:yes stop_codon:yes gene_type:complete